MNPSFNSYARFTWRWWRAWFDVPYALRQVKWYWQRATRGWADCDVWSLSMYNSQVMIGMLKRLKEMAGTPVAFYNLKDDMSEYSDEEVLQARTAWHAALDTMIAGFQAAYDLDDGPPDRFFTPRDPAVIAAEKAQAKIWVSPYDFDEAGLRAWDKEQRRLFAEGMKLFVEHYHALWD